MANDRLYIVCNGKCADSEWEVNNDNVILFAKFNGECFYSFTDTDKIREFMDKHAFCGKSDFLNSRNFKILNEEQIKKWDSKKKLEAKENV